jgi:hypothetical protein
MTRAALAKHVALLAMTAMLVACLHSDPVNPGSRASGINPADYKNSSCPDFSGTYKGVGARVSDGVGANDEWETRHSGTLYFDMVFPLTNKEDWGRIRNGYRRDEQGKFYVRPDYAAVKQLGPRTVQITYGYVDKVIGVEQSDYTDSTRYVCKDGRLIGGGAGVHRMRSLWSPKGSDGIFFIYIDANGDLIKEQTSQTHWEFIFVVPGGTTKSKATYRFTRISQVQDIR